MYKHINFHEVEFQLTLPCCNRMLHRKQKGTATDFIAIVCPYCSTVYGIPYKPNPAFFEYQNKLNMRKL